MEILSCKHKDFPLSLYREDEDIPMHGHGATHLRLSFKTSPQGESLYMSSVIAGKAGESVRQGDLKKKFAFLSRKASEHLLPDTAVRATLKLVTCDILKEKVQTRCRGHPLRSTGTCTSICEACGSSFYHCLYQHCCCPPTESVETKERTVYHLGTVDIFSPSLLRPIGDK